MKQALNPLYQAALEIQGFFEQKNWRFAFTGGLAHLRWGQHRTTDDVDGTLLTLFRDEEKIVKSILEQFTPRIADAETFALTRRVLLLNASNGVGVDISLGGLPFEERMVERSSLFTFGDGVVLRTCSAEDLIVFKAFAARDKDWADVRTILERQKGKLDTDYIFENLHPLCELKEAPEIEERLKTMLGIT